MPTPSHQQPSALEVTLAKLRAGPVRLRQKVAADKLGIGQTKLRHLVAAGQLETMVDGKCRYVITESLCRYLERLDAEQQSVDELVARMKRRRVQLTEDEQAQR